MVQSTCLTVKNVRIRVRSKSRLQQILEPGVLERCQRVFSKVGFKSPIINTSGSPLPVGSSVNHSASAAAASFGSDYNFPDHH